MKPFPGRMASILPWKCGPSRIADPSPGLSNISRRLPGLETVYKPRSLRVVVLLLWCSESCCPDWGGGGRGGVWLDLQGGRWDWGGRRSKAGGMKSTLRNGLS